MVVRQRIPPLSSSAAASYAKAEPPLPSGTRSLALHSEVWRPKDLLFLAALLAAFLLFLSRYAFDAQLSEWDLYQAAVGLWDGHHTASGIASTRHYGKWHSFGYILLVYALASPQTFAAGGDLFLLMNALGFWATAACLPLLWLALTLRYGREVAWPATALFIGSPVFLEVAGGAHPLLLALATLLLSTVLLWYPARGAAAGVLALLASAVLCLALTIRFEVVLVLPLLVLAPSGERGWRAYFRGSALRLVATAAACLGFFLLRSQVLAASEESSAEFFATWYHWQNIPIGLAALSLAVGLASIVVLAGACVWLARRMVRCNLPLAERLRIALPLLGPMAVLGTTFVFWIANPLPARHFLLFALAAAIVIAAAAAARLRKLRAIMAFAALLIAGNQLLSAAVNPIVVQASGFAAHRGWPYLLTAPSGFAWDRRVMLKEKWAAALAAGRVLASGRCGRQVIVSAPLSSAVVAQLVALQPRQRVSAHVVNGGGGTIAVTEVTEPVHSLVYTRMSLQDPALPAELLTASNLREFRLAVISDESAPLRLPPVPAGRLASPSCLQIGVADIDPAIVGRAVP